MAGSSDKGRYWERFERYMTLLYTRPGADERIRVGPGKWRLLMVLAALARLFRWGVTMRLRLYRWRILRKHTLGCQVISVGNITVGGTGKTPVVELFARELTRQGRKVAILSRGYRRVRPPWRARLRARLANHGFEPPPAVVSDGERILLDSATSGDEPFMLASNLPGVAVLVDKNRVKSGRFAVARLGCDVLLLDDGFQYMPLHHRVEILLIDKTNPFSNQCVLPRGLLREPIENISRAHFIFITKSDGEGIEALKARLRHYNAKAEIIECRHCPRHFRNIATGEELPLDWIRDRRVVAFSGIAVPHSFERALTGQGAEITEAFRFADHHRYQMDEFEELVAAARRTRAAALVTTEKDFVRLPARSVPDLPVLYLRVDIELLSGVEDFHSCIRRICFR